MEENTQGAVVRPNRSGGGGVEWLGWAAVIVLTLALAAWLGGHIQRHEAYSFDSDEGLHAYEALRVSAYLRDGDPLGVLAASPRESFYHPPVHAWLLGAALIGLRASRANARLFSLAVYALDVLLIYALGRWLARDTRWPWLAGLTAALLALAAPPMWVVSSLVYIEPVGILFMLITFWGSFWGYWQGAAGREWGWGVTGLGLVAAGLTKYPYWVFLIVPLSLGIILSRSPRRAFKRFALMLLPSVGVMAAWLAWPTAREGLADFITVQANLAQAAQPSVLGQFAFYLRSVAVQFSPSPVLAAGLAAALVISLLHWRDNRLCPLAIFFIWHVAGISTHGALGPRFLTTAMPALWLIGGVWMARAVEAGMGWLARWKTGRARRLARLAALAVFLWLGVACVSWLAQRASIYPMLYRLSLETDTRAMEVYRWTAPRLPDGAARIGLVNDWDQMSSFTLGWELTTLRAPAPRRADVVYVWAMHRLPEPTPENVAGVRDQMNARGLNYLIAYTAPGVGIKRLQGTLAILGDQTRALGERDFPLRWYWPDKVERPLYDGEPLDDAQVQRRLDEAGTDRSLTVHVYAYTP